MAALDLTPTTANDETALPLYAEEHESLREAARAFVQNELAPHVEDWETARDYPREVFTEVAAQGYFGLKFDERWGGSGPDYLAQAVWIEELAKAGSAGVAADLGAHSDLGMLYVDRAGTDEQRERYLRPGIDAESLGALAITEPGAGSDVAAIATRATRDGSDWILNGEKIFITNGAWCDWYVVAAKTDQDAGHGGISLFVVDADTPGVERSRMKMLGWRTSHTGQISFADVRVGAEALLGDEGSGFHTIMKNFVWERLSMSLGAVAGGEAVLQEAIAYGRERTAFDRPVVKFQVWRHRFADLSTRLATARALTEHALRLWVAAHGRGEDATTGGEGDVLLRTACMAKLVSQRLAFEVADECVQIHGGYGYMMEFPAQRHWRDARLGPIGGGTDEIMREIIAKTYGL